MLKLILPEEKYWVSFQKMLQDFQNEPSKSDPACVKSAFKYSYFADYQNNCENYRNGIDLKAEHVPYTCLWMIEDENVVGVCDIRHDLVPALELSGGHISYAVTPMMRNKGIATQALKLCCRYAADILKLENVLLTCKVDNIASYKTIKKVMIENGGNEINSTVVKGVEVKRVWIRTIPRPTQIRPLAVAVIRKDNKILALKGYDYVKNETFYRLIGGGIEFGERGEETIKREFMEEFGFAPKNIQYMTTIENIFTFNGHPGHEIVLVYEAALPTELADKTQFFCIEQNFKDLYATFVEVNNQNKIYPTGIF